MRIIQVIDRLRELTPLQAVGAAADLESAMDGVTALPAAFVRLISTEASAPELIGAMAQKIELQFGVFLAVRNRRDPKWQGAFVEQEELLLLLRDALVGWVPDPQTGEAVRYVGGKTGDTDVQKRLWWLDVYAITLHYRKT